MAEKRAELAIPKRLALPKRNTHEADAEGTQEAFNALSVASSASLEVRSACQAEAGNSLWTDLRCQHARPLQVAPCIGTHF